MLYVSIFVELLRSRPSLAVWLAALAQALLWLLVPALFYAGPPGDVPDVLAVGHEFQLGTYLGPPLAFWLAELAFDLAGRSMIGVYLLSQICVIVTYWAVFALARSIVGAQHAALAVLLMVGIAAFTVPTPDFGPVVLTMPLWAIILLHYWRAVGEGRRGYWLPLAIEIGLLLLTTYVGLILVGLLVLFTVANRHARAALKSYDPLISALVIAMVIGPHLVWVADWGEGLGPMLLRLRRPEAVAGNFIAWTRQIALIFAAHAVLPWLNIDLKVTYPAQSMARFFSESFERRTNAPLRIVTGDPRTAALIALGAPSRPSVFLSATPERSPWVKPDAIRTEGAIVVWPTTDTAGTPPAAIKEHFPELVPEVPRAFERSVQGRLPLLRIGWGVIRPQGQAVPSAAAGEQKP